MSVIVDRRTSFFGSDVPDSFSYSRGEYLSNYSKTACRNITRMDGEFEEMRSSQSASQSLLKKAIRAGETPITEDTQSSSMRQEVLRV